MKRFINNVRLTQSNAQAFLFSTMSQSEMLTVKVNMWTLALPVSLKQRPEPPVPAAAITFLEADLTDNVAAACEAEPWGGLAGLTEADVAKDRDSHGTEGQEGPAGSKRLRQVLTFLAIPRLRPTGLPPPCSSALRQHRALRWGVAAPLPHPGGLRAAEFDPHTPKKGFFFWPLTTKLERAPTQGILSERFSPCLPHAWANELDQPPGRRVGASPRAPLTEVAMQQGLPLGQQACGKWQWLFTPFLVLFFSPSFSTLKKTQGLLISLDENFRGKFPYRPACCAGCSSESDRATDCIGGTSGFWLH